MTLTVKLDWNEVEMYQRVKCIGQRSFRSKVIVRTDNRDTPDRLLYLDKKVVGDKQAKTSVSSITEQATYARSKQQQRLFSTISTQLCMAINQLATLRYSKYSDYVSVSLSKLTNSSLLYNLPIFNFRKIRHNFLSYSAHKQ